MVSWSYLQDIPFYLQNYLSLLEHIPRYVTLYLLYYINYDLDNNHTSFVLCKTGQNYPQVT